jgi:hypothetical protein
MWESPGGEAVASRREWLESVMALLKTGACKLHDFVSTSRLFYSGAVDYEERE